MPHDDTLSPATLAAQGVGATTMPHRDIVPPIHMASTFERDPDGSLPGGRIYARDLSPAYDPAEALLCRLEGGAAAALFASGMAAASAVLLALKPGMRIVAPRDMYWSLRNWLVSFTGNWGLTLDFYADSDELAALLARPADLVWVETPANPTWEVLDIAQAAGRAHAAGARLVVDSTVSTPVFTQPLALGADIVMHSATKYLNGHSDVVAGALITRAEDDFWSRIRTARQNGGAVPGPFEAWLLARGLRTLFPRVRTAAASALRIAQHFEHHPALVAVLYPGLPSHPGYDIACRQMKGGFGAMLSLRVKGGEGAARRVAGTVKIFRRATSLGSVESLIEHRGPIEGPGTRCPLDLLRISVGIEDADDLIADLEQALRDASQD